MLSRLQQKLGLDSKIRATILHAPSNYQEFLPPIQSFNKVNDLSVELEWILAFYLDKQSLDKDISLLVNKLAKSGQLWLSWPKKSSALKTDLSDSLIRSAGLDSGLVDVKIVSINSTWSALKFIYRLKDR